MRILRIANYSPTLALDTPFLLLPFRPSSDPSAARTFIRNYFTQSFEKGSPVCGDALVQELRLNEPMVRHTCDIHVRQDGADSGLMRLIGSLQCNEMVLEQIARRCGDVGGLRAVQGWRTRYGLGIVMWGYTDIC